MNNHTNYGCHSQITTNRRAAAGLAALVFASISMLALTGCIGLTAAGNPGSNTGPAASGTLSASAASLSFGNVAVGTSSTQSVTLTNTGTAAVTISQASVTGSGYSIVGALSSVVIAAGANQAFKVQFDPKSAGSDSGSVSIASNATDSSLAISLSGSGVTAPAITIQPASKSVIAGQSATFSVTAIGSAPLAYQWNKSGVAIGGATSASYTTPATTTADNGAQFTVTVSNASGTITSNVATLTVNAATYLLNASTASLNFSSVNIGSSATLPVTFTNGGNSSVTLSNVTISGAGFTASGIPSGQIVAPGQAATLNVTFTPAATGSLTGNVTVTSNASNAPASIALSGTGVQAVSHSVTLGWTASTSTVSGYNAYRSTVSGGPYTKLNSALIAVTSDVDSGVTPGTTYYYVVTAADASGLESGYSTEVSATVP